MSESVPSGDDVKELERVANCSVAISAENHLARGGLGSALAEALTDAGIGTRLRWLGLQDTYAVGGSQSHLLDRFGLSAGAILAAAELALDIRVDADNAASVGVGAGDQSRQEAL